MAGPITGIDATKVVAQYGAYYIDSGQGTKDISKRLYTPSETPQLFNLYPTNDTVVRKADARMSSILQAFQKYFTPKGGIQFLPNDIKLFKMKIDQLYFPDDLESDWLGFLAGQGLDRAAWPFIKWLLEVHMMDTKDQDMEEVSYIGIRKEPDANVAGKVAEAMDGVRKIVNDYISSSEGRVVPFSTGALSNTPLQLVEQIEGFVKGGIDKKYRRLPMTIPVTDARANVFKEGNRQKYNQNYAQKPDDALAVYDYPNIRLKPVGSMEFNNSNKLWTSPEFNKIRPQKRATTAWKVEQVDRQVKIYQDWWEGVGFITPELIFTNDQDLVNTVISSAD